MRGTNRSGGGERESAIYVITNLSYMTTGGRKEIRANITDGTQKQKPQNTPYRAVRDRTAAAVCHVRAASLQLPHTPGTRYCLLLPRSKLRLEYAFFFRNGATDGTLLGTLQVYRAIPTTRGDVWDGGSWILLCLVGFYVQTLTHPSARLPFTYF